MSSILSRLFGQQSGGLLGGQQVIPQGFMGPVQPPVQGPPAPTFLQNLERGSTRLVETPGFTNALTKLGTTLLTAREQGRSPGLGLALGAEGFLGELQQAQAAQQQASRQTLQDALLAAQTQQATAGTAKTVAETGLLAGKEDLSARKFKLDEKKFNLDVEKFDKDAAGGNLSDEELFKRGTKLRGEFAGLSTDFFKQRDAFGRVNASASDPSAAGDLALIFNYMKVLDPGSTVREGEFATAQSSGSVPSRIFAQYNKVLEGQRLAPKQRADFVNRAGKLFESANAQHNKRIDAYTGLSTKLNVDPQQVVIDLGLAEQQAAPTAPVAPGAVPFTPQQIQAELQRRGAL